MMLKIVKHPDPRLREVCTPFDDKEIESGLYTEIRGGATFYTTESLVKNMLETCRAANGVGMAAPQVGVMRRLIVLCVPGWEFAIVNPIITQRRHSTSSKEGCLSYPGRLVTVVRDKIVRCTGFDAKGEPIAVRASGLLSICIQHEIDHLDGVCKVGPKEAT